MHHWLSDYNNNNKRCVRISLPLIGITERMNVHMNHAKFYFVHCTNAHTRTRTHTSINNLDLHYREDIYEILKISFKL